MKLLKKIKGRVHRVKQKIKIEIHALFLAYKDNRTPWYAKVLLLITVGYALSPIDLIPDFIPILGYLDDIIILPLLIALAVKMIPKEILKECRDKAASISLKNPSSIKFPGRTTAALTVIIVWLLIITGLMIILFKRIY